MTGVQTCALPISYMQKSPSYNAPFTQNMETQPSATISNLGNMYKNAFNREADPAGLAFWQEQQKAGMSLGDIANYFAQSPEAVNRYGAEGTQNLSQLLGRAVSPNATTQPYKTLYTTGGAPIVNPDGSIASFPEVDLPSATQGAGQQGLYSESDIVAAGKGGGPNPGLLLWAGQSGNPMLAILAQQQAEEAQKTATAKADQMRAHNAAILNKPRSPMGYFMNLDYSTMSPSGLFGFNVVSPYYAQTYPTANPELDPTGTAWRSHGGKVERKGFDLGGDRKSTRLNSSHMSESRMPSSA